MSTSHGNSTTPLRKLIKKNAWQASIYSCFVNLDDNLFVYTAVAEEILNLSSMTNVTKDGWIRPDSKDYQVVFNYEFLEDFVDERKGYFSWFWNGLKWYASTL